MEGVAIITGGGTGIGADVARELSKRGVTCVLNYSRSKDEAEAVAAEIGNDAVAIQADIVEDEACERLVAQTVERFGRVDYLVNNAGRTKHAKHEDLDKLTGEDFVDIYRLNTVAAFQMTRAATPHLKKSPHGAIVNVASVAGVFGMGSSVAYAASKGALITMTKSLARALAPEIRVNAVAPGYVGTRWFEDRLGAEGFAALNADIASKTPLAMAPGPEDIAPGIVLLLDPAARTITGETLLLDAGIHLDVGLSRRPGREG